jgi:hypothetical protein
MAAMSDYLENKIIDHIFRATAYTMPAAIYMSLHTSNPLDAASGTEVSGNNYARAALAPSTSNWGNTQNSGTAASSGTGGQTLNKGIITFPIPSGSWGTVTHFAIWDASSAGNMLFHGALTVSKTISTSDVVTFPVDTLSVTLA